MNSQEIYDILDNSKKQTDALIALNIAYIGVSGQTVLKELKKIAKSVNFNKDISGKGFRERYKEKQKENYYNNPNYCEYCGNIISFEKRNNKCCSNRCASSLRNTGRFHTEETKQKISKSLYSFFSSKETKEKECCICHKTFIPKYTNKGKLSKSKTCSDECRMQLKIQNGRKAHESSVNNGTFKPWQSRNITSYAEKFWINVLDNNKISYTREFLFNKKYFFDFYIVKNGKQIDLEIDGKQHKYKDRIVHDKERDDYLKENNIIVYRVEWNSIKTDNGQKMMKDKIDAFIEFYKTLQTEPRQM